MYLLRFKLYVLHYLIAARDVHFHRSLPDRLTDRLTDRPTDFDPIDRIFARITRFLFVIERRKYRQSDYTYIPKVGVYLLGR